MKKYSISIGDKFSITLVFVAISYCFTVPFQAMSKSYPIQTCQIFLVVILWGILGCFWLYLLTTIIKINKNKYKAIAINNIAKQIILYEAKNKVRILPFDSIDYINIEKGWIIRGTALCQVRIISRNKTYIVNISKSDEFYFDMPKELNINMKEKLFFIAKVSK